MASTNIALADSRWVLCNFLSGNASRGSRWIAKEQRPFRVSTAGNRHCRPELHRICWIHGVAVNPVRLWRLHQSLTSASVFHVGQTLERCADSIRVSLRVRHELSASPDQPWCESDRPWSHAHVCYNFRDHHQSSGILQRAQLVPSIAVFGRLSGYTSGLTASQPRIGTSRNSKRNAGIGSALLTNITNFIANPGITSGRSASSAASASRTTCSTGTTTNFGPSLG